MLTDYNLYPLHVFRLVARGGSVTRAAEELHISQPAVSAHLRSLEERIGEALFERAPRRMLLTDAGEALFDQANRLLAVYEELPAAVSAARGRVCGEIAVAASSTPGAYFLPELLRQFQARYPQTQPALLVGDSAQVMAWLREYRAPLGVVGEMGMEDGLHRVEVGADRLQLVASADDPVCRARQLTTRHLRGRTLLLRESGSSTRSGAEALLGEWRQMFGRVAEIGSAEAIKQAVVAGLGVAVLSSWTTELEEKAGLLKPVRDARFRQARRFYLVRRRDRLLTGTAAALWECLAPLRRNGHSPLALERNPA